MAESIIYADLWFVKTPLRKNNSNPGEESDKDGKLTYENMEALSDPEAPTSLALAIGPEDETAFHMEQPARTWSSATAPDAEQILPYLQVTQQFGQMSRLLETSNSSLQEQLHLGTAQMRQREKDLQDSKEQLAQNERALEEEQGVHQAAEEQLQLCQANRTKMQENLHTLQRKLSHLQDTVRPFFTCPSQGTCCMVGWILIQRRCFHISLTKRDWQESWEYCKSLSSDLTTVTDNPWSYSYSEIFPWKSLLSQFSEDTSYWVGHGLNKDRWRLPGQCSMIDSHSVVVHASLLRSQVCSNQLPCICEMASFRISG
ncbi:B-cell differentiation antigen CD72-like isoform X2 [Ochotona curzoniae]|uniref:B-cell differentiation antigen CD72-like isoform X2 n=1 Tax=Ochotona curzoniae TaxID=130825 RepID=UPI001B353265|nr:B-cell differentiation antigen CD72-like isoform X2 [Ochotona curzoniae]